MASFVASLDPHRLSLRTGKNNLQDFKVFSLFSLQIFSEPFGKKSSNNNTLTFIQDRLIKLGLFIHLEFGNILINSFLTVTL